MSRYIDDDFASTNGCCLRFPLFAFLFEKYHGLSDIGEEFKHVKKQLRNIIVNSSSKKLIDYLLGFYAKKSVRHMNYKIYKWLARRDDRNTFELYNEFHNMFKEIGRDPEEKEKEKMQQIVEFESSFGKEKIEDDELEEKDIYYETNCEICMERERDVVFVPCGHTSCEQCSKKLKKCHVCREDIKMFMMLKNVLQNMNEKHDLK